MHPARMAVLLGLGLLGVAAAGVGLWRAVADGERSRWP